MLNSRARAAMTAKVTKSLWLSSVQIEVRAGMIRCISRRLRQLLPRFQAPALAATSASLGSMPSDTAKRRRE